MKKSKKRKAKPTRTKRSAKKPVTSKTQRRARRRKDNSAARAPLTIALGPDSFRFIEALAKRKAFRNVDDLFEAALMTYQRQSDALHAYIDMQIDKGFTREEILDSLRVEFVFTRLRRKKAKRLTRRS